MPDKRDNVAEHVRLCLRISKKFAQPSRSELLLKRLGATCLTTATLRTESTPRTVRAQNPLEDPSALRVHVVSLEFGRLGSRAIRVHGRGPRSCSPVQNQLKIGNRASKGLRMFALAEGARERV